MKLIAIPFALSAMFAATPLFAAQQDMSNMPGMHQKSAAAEGIGVVKAVDTDKGTITLQHQAIASIHWPAMTMTFKVTKPKVLQGVKAGDHVRFGLHPDGKNSTVTWIKPTTM